MRNHAIEMNESTSVSMRQSMGQQALEHSGTFGMPMSRYIFTIYAF